jgi:DNA-binding NtrC family response regulator
MAEVAQNVLVGKRLLIVEDEYMIADDLASALEEAGAEVVGPAGTVEDALELVQLNRGRLDGAVLDVNLRDERVYPVADVLASRGVPFVLATGYDVASMPVAYAQMPRCEKPVDKQKLMRLLLSQCSRW